MGTFTPTRYSRTRSLLKPTFQLRLQASFVRVAAEMAGIKNARQRHNYRQQSGTEWIKNLASWSRKIRKFLEPREIPRTPRNSHPKMQNGKNARRIIGENAFAIPAEFNLTRLCSLFTACEADDKMARRNGTKGRGNRG